MSQAARTPADDMDDTGDRAMQMHTSEGGFRLDTRRPIPACSGPCRQGRDRCATPDACQRPDDDDQSQSAGARVWPQLIAVAILSVLLCWHVASWLMNGGAA